MLREIELEAFVVRLIYLKVSNDKMESIMILWLGTMGRDDSCIINVEF